MAHSASLPASHGAISPPVKRTKLYAAEATGRSTGETFITVSVTRVLLTPRNAPATITAMINVGCDPVPRPIASRSRPKSSSTA